MYRILDPIDGLADCIVLGHDDDRKYEPFIFDWMKEDETVVYVLDGQGWSIARKGEVFSAIVRVNRCDKKDVGDSHIHLTARLPHQIVQKAAKFFREVFLAHRSEAFLYLLRRVADFPPDESADHLLDYFSGDWGLLCPTQTVASASVDYEKMTDQPNGWRVVGDFHSHAAMNAFHSGVDDKDEDQFSGVHITIGDLDHANGNYSYSCSVVVGGVREKVRLEDLLEEDGSCAAWLARVTDRFPASAAAVGVAGAYKHHGNNGNNGDQDHHWYQGMGYHAK